MENILWVQHTADAHKEQLERGAGIITTFRKGTKWLRPELIGQTMGLVNCSVAHMPPCSDACELFGTATVISVKACKFDEIEALDHQRQSGDMTPGTRCTCIGAGMDWITDPNCPRCGTRSKDDAGRLETRLDIMRSVYGEYDVDTLTTVITLSVNS